MEREFDIEIHRGILHGILSLPNDAQGIVLFIQDSGVGQHDSGTWMTVDALNRSRIATLQLDLLTPAEQVRDRTSGKGATDIDFLTDRVESATIAIRTNPFTLDLPLGYLGSGNGAAAALLAASRHPTWIDAIVSQEGGRPDLAGNALSLVRSPTLLLVGGADYDVLNLNRIAFDKLRCERALSIVADDSQFLEEDGAIEQVAQLTEEWFLQHLAGVVEATIFA